MKIVVNGTHIVLERLGQYGLRQHVKEIVRKLLPKRVVFIDTAPSQALLSALEWVRSALPEAQIFVRDHHDVDIVYTMTDMDTCVRAANIRNFPGVEATISTRKRNPACSSLVEVGEFTGEGTLIIADGDLDGTTAALKAAGVWYPQMDSDSDLFDGPPEFKNREAGMSHLGVLLQEALSSVPIRDKADPSAYDNAKIQVIQCWIEAVMGSESAHERLVALAVLHVDALENTAAMLASSAELKPGLWAVCVDPTKRYSPPDLFREFADRGALIVLLEKSGGMVASRHGGQEIHVHLMEAGSRQGINLRRIFYKLEPKGRDEMIADGYVCHVPFSAHVSQAYLLNRLMPALVHAVGAEV